MTYVALLYVLYNAVYAYACSVCSVLAQAHKTFPRFSLRLSLLDREKTQMKKTQTEKSGRERKTANTQKQPVQIAISNNEIKQVSFSHCWHSKLI